MPIFNPDSILEKVIIGTVPIWGPFYAIFYIIRLMLHELFSRKE